MANLKQKCIDYFKMTDYHYHLDDDGDIYVIYSETDDYPETRVYATFDDEDNVHLYSFVYKVNESNYAKALIACNTLNQKYKWVRFSITEKGSIMTDMYLLLPSQNPGPVFRNYLERWMLNLGAAKTQYFKDVDGTTPFSELDSFMKHFER